jgi:cytochrome P450
MPAPRAADVPHYPVDLFTDDVVADPYDHYRAIRDLGPVVWLPAHDVYAVARHRDVRAVLEDAVTFRSGLGVGFNDFINEAGRGTTLMSDGDAHRRLRGVIAPPLTPRAIGELRRDAEAIADRLVDNLVRRGTFDAIADLAHVLPSVWVPDLLGWPAENRDRLLDWAGATFDGLGPFNDRTIAAGNGIMEMSAFAQQLAGSDLPAGSMAAGIIAASARGEIEPSQCPMAIIDYLGPSLDTTVSAIGNAVWLFATNPDQWSRLRDEPGRVRSAFNEVLRLESPISCFSRVTATPAVIDGAEIPAGARILVSYASANRDERHWDRAEQFDITRESADQLAFGHGEHACVGMGLARLEGAAILSALVARVERIELDGPPQRKLNNLIRSFGSLPVAIHAA